MPRNNQLTIHNLFQLFIGSECLVTTLTSIGFATLFFTGWILSISVHNIYNENCNERWIHLDTAELKNALHANVYGEHIAVKTVIKLRNLIEDKVKQCGQSMFIFDEVDKLSPELLNILKPYLDHHEHIDNNVYRKSIFIFLSNTAGPLLNKHMLDFWRDGKTRDEIDLKDLENIIANSSVNSEGSGYYKSDLILHHLITAFVPFLPIERACDVLHQTSPGSESNTAVPLLNKQLVDFWYDDKKREEIDLKDLEFSMAKSAINTAGSE
ncbi:TOR1 [Mytilus edulis]|uniref:TOR1 n=1 Tax=Mytilus edulis TaxID=6550 RepID=A0A8S3QCN1_MYTED|nr:TOR1 [Mytilus edulis]